MSGRCGCRMAVKTTTEYPPSRHLHNFLRVRTPPLPFAHPPRPTQPLPGFCCRAHAATAPPWRTRRTMQLHGAARDLFSVGFSVFPCFFPQRAPTSRTHTPHAPCSVGSRPLGSRPLGDGVYRCRGLCLSPKGRLCRHGNPWSKCSLQ